jgi:hypothetical protein
LKAAALHLASCQTIAAISNAAEHQFLVVKGPVLGASGYGDPSLRRFSDIDVLVPRRDFGNVIDGLRVAGFVELSSNWEGFLDLRVAEIPLKHQPLTVDLHWDLVAIETTRRELTWAMAPLFGRVETVDLGGNVTVASLDAADTLLHLCINSGLDGARILVRLVDVDVVVRTGRVEWPEFAERARAASAGALCAAVLQRCNSTVGTPVPGELLAHLEPFRGWLRVNAFVDQRRRDGRRLTNGVASGALLASGRATRRATLGRLSRTVGSYAASKLGRPQLTETGGALHWQRRPVRHDLATARQRYLSRVADS